MSDITKEDILTTLKVHRALRAKLPEVHQDYSWVGLEESARAAFEVRYDIDDVITVRFVDLTDPAGIPKRERIAVLRQQLEELEQDVRVAGGHLANALDGSDADVRARLKAYSDLVTKTITARGELRLALGG